MHRIGKNDMKYAYLIMGRYDEKTDRAEIQDGKARIGGVKDLETACTVANELIKEGVNCIELCGGFGSAGAKAIIEATGNEIPIGYITHLPEQDELYAKVFSKK